MKLGFFGLLTLVFVAAKLFDKIDWSWWLVVSPAIAGWALSLIFGLIALVVAVRK